VVQAQAAKLYEQGRQAVDQAMHRDGHDLPGAASGSESMSRTMAEADGDEPRDSSARRQQFSANSF
jgi:hypothetical protein